MPKKPLQKAKRGYAQPVSSLATVLAKMSTQQDIDGALRIIDALLADYRRDFKKPSNNNRIGLN